MPGLLQALLVVGLGAFWGVSPALNKVLGWAGLPVSHILAFSGAGVGVGLIVLQRALGGKLRLGRREALYGLGCGILLNVPWGIGLLAVRHVPVTLYSVVVSSTPMWTYGLALLVGRERMSLMRVSALAVGFASSLAVILTRQGASISQIDSWLLAAMSLPLMYAFYNVYTSAAWPKGMEPLTAGIVESFASSLLAVPVVLWLDPVHSLSDFHRGYWLLAAAIAMWVLERVCFFSMIQRFGPVTTVQAVYVSTPAGVLFGLALFAEKADSWLWVSLALVMLALWLNNRAIAKAR